MKTINFIKSDIRIGIVFLIIFHAINLVGISIIGNDFIVLTPFNFLLTLSILLIYHENYSKDFFRFLILVYVASFAIELIGVRTGKIFGEYYFGTNLGFLVKGVPIIIGISWLTLCLSTAYISNFFFKNIYLKSIIATILILFIIFFIDQLAPVFNFWFWKNNVTPIQNYLALFVVFFFFQLMIWSLKFNIKNKIAPYVYTIQLVFFIVLFLLNH